MEEGKAKKDGQMHSDHVISHGHAAGYKVIEHKPGLDQDDGWMDGGEVC